MNLNFMCENIAFIGTIIPSLIISIRYIKGEKYDSSGSVTDN